MTVIETLSRSLDRLDLDLQTYEESTKNLLELEKNKDIDLTSKLEAIGQVSTEASVLVAQLSILKYSLWRAQSRDSSNVGFSSSRSAREEITNLLDSLRAQMYTLIERSKSIRERLTKRVEDKSCE